MRIIVTFIALMPLSLYAYQLTDSGYFKKLPYGINPFKMYKDQMVDQWGNKYGSKLITKYQQYLDKVAFQWDDWLGDFYHAASDSPTLVRGEGLNSWRNGAEEHLMQIAREAKLFPESYETLAVQELLAGFRSFAITAVEIALVARSTILNPLKSMCWPTVSYGDFYAYHDCPEKSVCKCKDHNGILRECKIVTKDGDFSEGHSTMTKGKCFPTESVKPNNGISTYFKLFPNCSPYSEILHCALGGKFPPESFSILSLRPTGGQPCKGHCAYGFGCWSGWCMIG